MNLRNRPTRLVAAVGAVLAAGTTTFMALTAGTASADEPGRCTQNVNVREDPDANSKIVALCEAGKEVKLGEERDGFVRLDELGGWASKDYVKADDAAAANDQDADQNAADDASEPGDAAGDDGDHAGSHAAGHVRSQGDNGDDSGDNNDATHGDQDPSTGTSVNGNGVHHGALGGLLG